MAQQKKEQGNQNQSQAKKKKVEILVWNLAGKYNLPYNKGQKVEVDAKVAKEMIDNGDAK